MPVRQDVMKEEQIISWIFLAVALASNNEPSDIKGISIVADGINHAVSTQKELRLSFSWLANHGLIQKLENKYELTQKGKKEYADAKQNTSTLFKIWKNLELRVKDYS